MSALNLSAHVSGAANGPGMPLLPTPGELRHGEGGLQKRRWIAAHDSAGRLTDFNDVRRKVRRGGVDPDIRPEVWEILLGCYSPDSTTAEREALREQRRLRFDIVLSEWMAESGLDSNGKAASFGDTESTAEGRLRTSSSNPGRRALDGTIRLDWSETRRLIKLDVFRTDRELPFFSEPGSKNASRMERLLCTYAWLDKDLGYCQGMADILSPFLVLFRNDADAFWAFYRLMQAMRFNFLVAGQGGQMGAHGELRRVSFIIGEKDAELKKHLKKIHSDDCLFLFRMLIVLFRRELSIWSCMLVWEICWAKDWPEMSAAASKAAHREGVAAMALKREGSTQLLGPEYSSAGLSVARPLTVGLHLYIMAAIMSKNSKTIREEASAPDELLKVCYRVFSEANAKQACRVALKLRKRLKPETINERLKG